MAGFDKVDLLIKNGKVYTEAGFQDLDVGVKGEKIVSLAEPGAIKEAQNTIDAKGKYILPGIIDFHTHIREPGFTHKEDFETATRAAVAGGVTMVCPQPNLDPVPNTVENYRKQVELGKKKSLVDFNAIASPLLYDEGWVPKLASEGTAWFKIFQKQAAYPYSTSAGTINTANILGAFREIAETELYCAVHPFDHFFFDEAPNEVKKAGLPMTLKNYLRFIYTDEEMSGAAYELYYLAKRARVKWYALHCWLPSYIDLVRWAKTEKAIDVIASVECMASVLVSEKAYDIKRGDWFEFGLSPLYDTKKIWDAINDGTIDFIGSDHAPHQREEADKVDPLKANMGFPILDWYGHLLLNEVNNGNISLERLVEVTSVKGAKIFGWYPRKGSNLPGTDADFTICDLNKEWTVTSDKVYTKTQLNPYHGRKLKGKVTHTIIRGKVVMKDGEVLGEPGYGEFIRPEHPSAKP